MKKHDIGHQSLRSEQLLLSTLITDKLPDEKIIIHHVVDTVTYLRLDIERRSPSGIRFERKFFY